MSAPPESELSDLLAPHDKARPLWLRALCVAGAVVFFLLGIIGWLIPVMTGIPFYVAALVLLGMASDRVVGLINRLEGKLPLHVRLALRRALGKVPRRFRRHLHLQDDPESLISARLERIDDPADARVADYRDQAAGQRLRPRATFVAEGREVVGRLLASARFATRSVLGTEATLTALAERLAARPEVRVLLAPAPVIRAIVGFRFHRGCLAAGERGDAPPPAALIDPPGPRLVVALEDLSDPDNVGAIFRSASALGADAVLLSRRCADPLYRKSIRVSAGAVFTLPFARPDAWPDALAALRAAGYTLVALTPRAGARDIDALDAARAPLDRVALLLGAEDHGLAEESIAAADLAVRIPMVAGADSLNVAVAAGIALHRLRRA